jgi:K+ transporter
MVISAPAIIASQAVITGAFSLARQAVHLGFLPRLLIAFTSETNTGQIYVPAVNTLLFVGMLVLIFTFGDSESLATAYGISVTGAMVVTTLMAFQFLRSVWGWSAIMAGVTLVPLLLLETVFLGANLLKIHDGGSKALALCKKAGLKFEIMQTSFYLGRRTLVSKVNSGLPGWQDKLYIALSGLGIDPSAYFSLSANRVVEIGEQVAI